MLSSAFAGQTPIKAFSIPTDGQEWIRVPLSKPSILSNISKKKPLPLVNSTSEDEYVTIPKSNYFKRQLKKYGTHPDAIKAARAALQFHESEIAHIKKYLARAFDHARDEWMDDSDNSDYEWVCKPKRQKMEDQQMKKE